MVRAMLEILFPLLLLIAAGYAGRKLLGIEEESLVRIVTDFLMPMLVFSSLCTTDLQLRSMGRVALADTPVLLVLLVSSLVYAAIARIDRAAYVPP